MPNTIELEIFRTWNKMVDYDYILNKLNDISESATLTIHDGYNPAYNVALMLDKIQKLVRIISNETDKK